MYRIYGMSLSGNCYKLQLIMHLLDLEYEWVDIDLFKGETQENKFLKKNPNGKVPVLEVCDGVNNENFLPESNAGLYYLANGTSWFPNKTFHQAQVIQWLCFEQYSHEPAIAVARFISKFLPPDHQRRKELPQLHERGYIALDVMESHLADRDWFVGESPTIADISLFAYTHVAQDGQFYLETYSNISRWLNNVTLLKGFRAMG